MAAQVQRLEDDFELIDAMKNEMRFVEDPHLHPHNRHSVQQQLEADQRKLELIQYFEETYGNTDQDTVFYGPEFVIVVRNILAGKRPVKLRYLTEFQGEEK